MSILDIMSFCKSRELEVISAFFQQPPCYKPLSFGVILSVHKYVAEFVRNLLCSPVSLEIIELRTHTQDTLRRVALHFFLALPC